MPLFDYDQVSKLTISVATEFSAFPASRPPYREDSYGRREDNNRDERQSERYSSIEGDGRAGGSSANRPNFEDEFQSRRVPISLEDMKRMKEAQESAESKPVFLTKAQRRANALKMREAEVSAQRGSSSTPTPTGNDDKRVVSSYSNGGAARREGDGRGDAKREFPMYGDAWTSRVVDDRERDMELELIRREKLGLVEQKKRKVTKSNARAFTAKVEYWDDTEDTSLHEHSSLYRHQVESRPQFGRGSLAGMGELEQTLTTTPKPSEEYSWTKKPMSEMSARDWRILREDFEIVVKGSAVPNPLRSWNESDLPEWALRAITDAKYNTPTPIQRQAIPIGMQGRDMIGIAETGSGKTVSFLLPLLYHISQLQQKKAMATSSTLGHAQAERDEGPYACILAPTRELALQIKVEADKFSKYANCRTVLLIGGEDIQGQISELRRGCEVIVATTGRLVQLLNDAWITLSHCHYVVLDEGDRMIDMGFEDQLLQILDAMPTSPPPEGNSSETHFGNSKSSTSLQKSSTKFGSDGEKAALKSAMQNSLRTTVLFSATMPPAVERIANKYLRNPVTVYVGDVGKTVDRIKQNVEFFKSDSDKRRRLQELLHHGPKPPIIIFMNHKASCDAIAKYVEKFGFSAVVLHAGKSQEAREWAISQFKGYQADILVATNVAGRGLDVKGVTHVINFDLPDSIEEYTHRIGRTGRAGMDGLATSFLMQTDEKIAPALRQLLQRTNSKIPRELNDLAAQSSGVGKSIF